MKILAPLDGVIFPITDVPDPVFGQKMLGDGVAVDPTNTVLTAPFSAEITQLHDSHHALTLRHANGMEMLIHIGLDTVMLKGEGFKPLVKEGDKVTAGQKLIEFDADFIAQNAISLLTMMVVTSQHEQLQITPEAGTVKAAESTVLNISFKGDDAVSEDSVEQDVQSSGITVSEEITIPNPAGLHARPAAVSGQCCPQLHQHSHPVSQRKIIQSHQHHWSAGPEYQAGKPGNRYGSGRRC